jgi:hypothetical protein
MTRAPASKPMTRAELLAYYADLEYTHDDAISDYAADRYADALDGILIQP